ERAADAVLAGRRADVELLEPGGVAAVLERPDERDVGDADEPVAVAGDEDAAAARLGEDALDRVLDGGAPRVDVGLGELGEGELDDRGGVFGAGEADLHGESLPFARARRSSLAAASAGPRSGTSGRKAGTVPAIATSSARRSGASASSDASRVGRSAS